jgi:16S rRNA (guanine966-N2)-methyltransferase
MALRVVAGALGGRRLVAPKGPARPTTDRIKEALFASLGRERVDGATVLDLYAGSGALAIEALSRGAARAVLVDRDFGAEVAVRANLETLGLAGIARFEQATVEAFLAHRAPEGPFDLVLLDPPYDTPSETVGDVLTLLAAGSVVAPGATVVLERPKAAVAVPLPAGWQIEKERPYGDTLLLVAIA